MNGILCALCILRGSFLISFPALKRSLSAAPVSQRMLELMSSVEGRPPYFYGASLLNSRIKLETKSSVCVHEIMHNRPRTCTFNASMDCSIHSTKPQE